VEIIEGAQATRAQADVHGNLGQKTMQWHVCFLLRIN
jgi:hypothetical protein